jgi:hypothetical protein
MLLEIEIETETGNCEKNCENEIETGNYEKNCENEIEIGNCEKNYENENEIGNCEKNYENEIENCENANAKKIDLLLIFCLSIWIYHGPF